MTFEEKCSFIKSGPDDGYNRLAKEVIEEYQRRLGKAAARVFGATYDRLTAEQQLATIAENVRLGAELAAVRRQLGDDHADDCHKDRRKSDELVCRANILLFDLLGRLAVSGSELPAAISADIEQWAADSREAINRSLE